MYILYFYYDFLKYYFIYTLKDKSQDTVVLTIRGVITLIKRQYRFDVKYLHYDGDTALVTEYRNMTQDLGLVFEQAVPDTQDQNESAERSRGVVINRARALHLDSKLLYFLQPEFIHTAGYLLNRSPVRSLNWVSPIVKLQQVQETRGFPFKKPLGLHFVTYRYKAYTFIKDIPKLQKLAARAHIGQFYGYVSTNIFRVWIPELKRIISTRDVVFDELSKFQPSVQDTRVSEELINLIDIPWI